MVHGRRQTGDPLHLFELAIRTLDTALEPKGITRGKGSDVKSCAKIVCPEDQVEFWSRPENQGWATPYVRETCKILPPNTPTEYLGTMTGGVPENTKSMQLAMQRTSDKREGIAELNHPASELVMLRRVTDVANITYWMRCQGDLLDSKTAAEFDADLRTALGNTFGGEIPEHSWWQAGLAVKCGGLGLRSATAVAPPRFP